MEDRIAVLYREGEQILTIHVNRLQSITYFGSITVYYNDVDDNILFEDCDYIEFKND